MELGQPAGDSPGPARRHAPARHTSARQAPATGLRGFGRELRLAAQADIVSNVIDIVAAVLAILVVRHLTRLVREAQVVS